MKTPQEMLEKIGTVDFLDVDKLASYLCDLEKKIDSKMDNTVVLYEAPGSYAEGYKKGQIDEAIDHQTKDVQIVKENCRKCLHELCPVCKNCHNLFCSDLQNPLNLCKGKSEVKENDSEMKRLAGLIKDLQLAVSDGWDDSRIRAKYEAYTNVLNLIYVPNADDTSSRIPSKVKESDTKWREGALWAVLKCVEAVQNHHKMNTYEGDDANLYHTTLNEIISLLSDLRNKVKKV